MNLALYPKTVPEDYLNPTLSLTKTRTESIDQLLGLMKACQEGRREGVLG